MPRSVVLRPRRTDRRRGPARTPPTPPPARDFRTGRREIRSGPDRNRTNSLTNDETPSDVAGREGLAGRRSGGSAARGASSHRRIRCPRLDRWSSGAFARGARGFDRLGRRARRGRWSTGGPRTATATATAGSSSTAAPTRPVLGRGEGPDGGGGETAAGNGF